MLRTLESEGRFPRPHYASGEVLTAPSTRTTKQQVGRTHTYHV